MASRHVQRDSKCMNGKEAAWFLIVNGEVWLTERETGKINHSYVYFDILAFKATVIIFYCFLAPCNFLF